MTIWRNALLSLGGLLVWLLYWYGDTAAAMVGIWFRSDTYAHGFVVPAISLWLIWRKRQVLAAMLPRPGLLAWPLIVACAVLWLLGDLVAVNAATQFALVAMLVLTVPAVLGWQVTAELLFPLGFMFFAVPIGDFMMPQLMEWTADFTVLALRASGIPVYREGQHFVIPSGNWSVVEACSGIRYLIASVTVGCLFAYLSYQSTRRRLVFVLVSFLVPVVANWLRAYIIVMLGHYSGNTIATGVDHLIYGWLFFGIVIMIMFMVGARWAQHPAPQADGAALAASVAFATKSGANIRPFATPLATLVVALLAVTPHVINWFLVHNQNLSTPVVAVVPPAAGWQASLGPLSDWAPAFENTSAQSRASYTSAGGATVGVYIGYYRNQNYQRKLVSSDNTLVKTTDKTWSRVASGVQGVSVNQQPLTARSGELRRLQPDAASGNELRLLVWQFYWVNGHLTSSDALAKIYGALGRLMGQGDDGAVIMVYTPKQAGAAGVLQSFLDAHGSATLALLQQTRSQRQTQP
jgi:exosortase A